MGKAMIGNSHGKNVIHLRGCMSWRVVSLFDSHRERLSTYEPLSPRVLTDRMVHVSSLVGLSNRLNST
jgi:hypothetical protein